MLSIVTSMHFVEPGTQPRPWQTPSMQGAVSGQVVIDQPVPSSLQMAESPLTHVVARGSHVESSLNSQASVTQCWLAGHFSTSHAEPSASQVLRLPSSAQITSPGVQTCTPMSVGWQP